MNILQLIASNSFITTNKSIIKLFGLIEANIIGLFASMANFNNKDDGWFYITYSKIEEELNISKHISSKAIEKLIESGVLIDKKQGVPCRRFFKFQEEELFNSLKLNNLTTGSKKNELLEVNNFNFKESDNLTTSSKDNSRLAVKEFNSYNNKDNNKDNNLSSLEETKKYFSDNNYKSDYKKFWLQKGVKEKPKFVKSAADLWELNFREMFPEKYKETTEAKKKSKDEIELEKELELLADEIKRLCHIKLNDVMAAQYLDLNNLKKTIKGYEVVAINKEKAKGYKEILKTINVKLKFK